MLRLGKVVPGIDVDPKEVATNFQNAKQTAKQNIFMRFYLKSIKGNYKYTQTALKTRKED